MTELDIVAQIAQLRLKNEREIAVEMTSQGGSQANSFNATVPIAWIIAKGFGVGDIVSIDVKLIKKMGLEG